MSLLRSIPDPMISEMEARSLLMLPSLAMTNNPSLNLSRTSPALMGSWSEDIPGAIYAIRFLPLAPAR